MNVNAGNDATMNVNICYALHDEKGSFSKFVGTSMASVFMHTNARVVVHLLHDDSLSAENREKFEALAKEYGQSVRFYNVEELATQGLIRVLEAVPEMESSRFSVAAFYRLFMGSVLPPDVHRVIYLDSDTIVNLDIVRMWREPVGANGLAAISEVAITHDFPAPQPLVESGEVARERYFNSGVMLIDMDALRQRATLIDDSIAMLKAHPQTFCYDQDVLNYFFSRDYHELPALYDKFVSIERHFGISVSDGIYHYAGKALDFFIDDDPYNELFLNSFCQTPWFSQSMIKNFFREIQKSYGRWRDVWRISFNAAAGRERIFCGDGTSERFVREIFDAKKGEPYRVVVDDEGNLFAGKLIAEMKKHRNALYVLCFAGLDALRPYLDDAGLRDGVDYIEGGQYLPSGKGGWELTSGDFFDEV